MSKVLYEKRDRIAYVTINRPEARNAIDPDVHRLMVETWAVNRIRTAYPAAVRDRSRRAETASPATTYRSPPSSS